MDEIDELKAEIERLKSEIEFLRFQNTGQSQGIVKRKAEVAGSITDTGIFEEEVKKLDFSDGLNKEEVKLTTYFSVNGRRLEKEKVSRCSFCNLILTDAEKIEIKNRIYCEKCLRQKEHDLDKEDFKILLCISYGIASTSEIMEYLGFCVTIQKITGLDKTEVEQRVQKLFRSGYIYVQGFINKSARVTSKGEEGLAAFNQIYLDYDCNAVKQRIAMAGR